MKLTIEQIQVLINEQVEQLKLDIISSGFSREEMRSDIEDKMTFSNCIIDRADEFADDVDEDNVLELNKAAMDELISELNLTDADDMKDAQEGIEYSHLCSGSSFNNMYLEAYSVDDDTYRIFRYVVDAMGYRESGFESIDISKEDYNNIDEDPYNEYVRFKSVNELFGEQY